MELEQISRAAIFDAQIKSAWVGGRGLQNREIRATLTTEGRGGGRANSQPPEEVLSGSSCVPPDSWHSEGGGSVPPAVHSCPLGHTVPPQLFPVLQLGCLIGDLSQHRETTQEAG